MPTGPRGRMDEGRAAIRDARRAPGEDTSWDAVPTDLEQKGHYLDAFLGRLKRDAYLALLNRWRARTGVRILKTDLFEEGMGPDAFLHLLAEAAPLAVGIDVSLAVAHRAAVSLGRPGLVCLVADVRSLPFRTASFDTIVSPSTLDHFADPDDLGVSLVELRRTLAVDGRLLVTLDNRQNVFDPLLRVVNRLGLVPYFLGRSYRISELRSELATAGYVVEEVTAIVHNPRLLAAGLVAVANRLSFRPLTRLVHGLLTSMQRLEATGLRWRTGCFVAALARPSPAEADAGDLKPNR